MEKALNRINEIISRLEDADMEALAQWRPLTLLILHPHTEKRHCKEENAAAITGRTVSNRGFSMLDNIIDRIIKTLWKRIWLWDVTTDSIIGYVCYQGNFIAKEEGLSV